MGRAFDIGPRRPRPPHPTEHPAPRVHQEPRSEPAATPRRHGTATKTEVKLYYFGLLFLVLVLAGLYASQGKTLSGTAPAVPTPAIGITYTALPPLLTATPGPSPTPLVQSSSTPVPVVTSTPNQNASISLRVLNGSGKSERLATATAALQKAGFTISSSGTARNHYNTTVIYYGAGKLEKAKAVQNALVGFETSLTKSSIVGSNDVLVVVGTR